MALCKLSPGNENYLDNHEAIDTRTAANVMLEISRVSCRKPLFA